jgi:hypothetical protein
MVSKAVSAGFARVHACNDACNDVRDDVHDEVRGDVGDDMGGDRRVEKTRKTANFAAKI